jgi:hypothetical protein
MADPATDDRRLTTAYRVAVVRQPGQEPWTVLPHTFAEHAYAQEWAHNLLWSASSRSAEQAQRWRLAHVLSVVGGVVQVPSWMRVRSEEV